MEQNHFNTKSRKWCGKCGSNVSKINFYLKYKNGACLTKRERSRVPPKQRRPNDLECEDSIANEKDYNDCERNNLNNGP